MNNAETVVAIGIVVFMVPLIVAVPCCADERVNVAIPASFDSTHCGVTVPRVVVKQMFALGTGLSSADRATALTVIFSPTDACFGDESKMDFSLDASGALEARTARARLSATSAVPKDARTKKNIPMKTINILSIRLA